MTKYSESLRLEVVQKYQAAGLGYAAVAKLFGINAAAVRRWVECFREHGLDGVRKKHSGYFSAEFKLKVLRRAERRKLSNRQAAALFDLRGWGPSWSSGDASTMRVARRRSNPNREAALP